MTTVENLDPYSYGFLSHLESQKIAVNFFAQSTLRESPRIDYKSKYSIDKILKLVCAFANTRGGHILVGVDDKTFNIQGVSIKKNIDEDELSYQREINDKLGFSIVECRIIEIANNTNVLLHIKVKEHQGSACPIFIPKDHNAYHRVGTEVKPMNPQEIVSYAYIKNLSTVSIDDYLETIFVEAKKEITQQPEIAAAIINESMFQAEKGFVQNIGDNYFKKMLLKQADANLSYDLLKQSGILLKSGMSSANFCNGESYFRLPSSIHNIKVSLQHIFGLSGRVFPYFGDKLDSSEKKIIQTWARFSRGPFTLAMWYGSPDGFDAELLIGDHDIGQIMGFTNTIGLRDSNEPYFVRKLSKKDLCDVFADFPKNPDEQMRHFLTSLLKT